MRAKINSLPIKDIQTEENLLIRIADNGKGINMAKLCQFGNCLKKIAKRMESIGGHSEIVNSNGTISSILLPL